MNLLQHREAVRNMTPVLRLRVLNYFSLPFLRGNLCDQLYEHGLCQADLVLCLLRIGGSDHEARRVIARLIGHEIQVCAPRLRGFVRPPKARASDNDLRVTWVGENKFLNGTERSMRFRMLRPGMLLSQYRVRGGKRRDLREALRNGSIRVEKVA